MTLDEARECVGRSVVYRPEGSDPPEYGVIAGVGEKHVFVRSRPGQLAKATDPADLTVPPMTVHQRAREDVRRMWNTAFGCDPQ